MFCFVFRHFSGVVLKLYASDSRAHGAQTQTVSCLHTLIVSMRWLKYFYFCFFSFYESILIVFAHFARHFNASNMHTMATTHSIFTLHNRQGISMFLKYEIELIGPCLIIVGWWISIESHASAPIETNWNWVRKE